jgi:hypothetical protein
MPTGTRAKYGARRRSPRRADRDGAFQSDVQLGDSIALESRSQKPGGRSKRDRGDRRPAQAGIGRESAFTDGVEPGFMGPHQEPQHEGAAMPANAESGDLGVNGDLPRERDGGGRGAHKIRDGHSTDHGARDDARCHPPLSRGEETA